MVIKNKCELCGWILPQEQLIFLEKGLCPDCFLKTQGNDFTIKFLKNLSTKKDRLPSKIELEALNNFDKHREKSIEYLISNSKERLNE